MTPFWGRKREDLRECAKNLGKSWQTGVVFFGEKWPKRAKKGCFRAVCVCLSRKT